MVRLLISSALVLAGLPAPAAAQIAPSHEQVRVHSSQGCLAAAIYHEARSETDAGQRAVAQVIMNRLRHPAYPKTVCDVVLQGIMRTTGCQFSFTCDGSLARTLHPTAWQKAQEIAGDALAGRNPTSVGDATHYHTTAIRPYWALSLKRIATLGSHIFYSDGRLARGTRAAAAPAAYAQATADAPAAAAVKVHRGAVPPLAE